MRLQRLLVLVCFGLLVGGVGRSAGAEIRLGEAASCSTLRPEVASFPGGGFVAVWAAPLVPGALADLRVFARFFDAAGRPLGPETLVSTLPGVVPGRLSTSQPVVAVNGQGTVLIAWALNDVGLVGRLYDATGSARGEELVLDKDLFLSTLAVTADRQGGFSILASDGGGLYRWRLDSSGQLLGQRAELDRFDDVTFPGGGSVAALDVAAAALPSSDLAASVTVAENAFGLSLLAGYVQVPLESNNFYQLDVDGMPRSAIAANPAGSVLVAWTSAGPRGPVVRAVVVDETGETIRDEFLVDESFQSAGDSPDVAVDGAGNFLVAWRARGGRFMLRRISPQGELLGPSRSLPLSPAGHAGIWAPAISVDAQDRLAMVWGDSFQSGWPGSCFPGTVFAATYDVSPNSLLLQDGRFQVSVRWTDHQGQTGQGHPVALTADSGYFWFFGPGNVELMVKVLDGRAVNGRFWLFYASLSDVSYTLTVTDTVTGISKDSVNPAGQLASSGDTSTFSEGLSPVQPGASRGEKGDEKAAGPAADGAAPGPVGPCFDPSVPTPRRPGLCLGGRFEVEVFWRDLSTGAFGIGEGVRLTADSGYLWFFGANNVELVVKVLDGRAVNGRFWVFYGALSNVEYTITVRDTVTHAERVYTNPAGQLASRADTSAF